MRVVVLSGSGRYADLWHDFPATSERLARLLTGPGRTIRVERDVEDGLARLDEVDLLVVNAGDPRDEAPNPAASAAIGGLRTYVARGGPVLAVHASASTFSTEPGWAVAIGGRWIPGVSMHPPYGAARLRRTTTDHPVVAGLGDLELTDERYSYLATEPGITALYDHEHDGVRHPAIWALETADGRRAVYDGLGHSVDSYDNEGHRRVLRQAAGWLLRET